MEKGIPWDHSHPKTPDSADADTTNGAGNNLDKTSKGKTISRMYRIHLAQSARELNEDHNVHKVQHSRDDCEVSQVRVKLTVVVMSSKEERDKSDILVMPEAVVGPVGSGHGPCPLRLLKREPSTRHGRPLSGNRSRGGST